MKSGSIINAEIFTPAHTIRRGCLSWDAQGKIIALGEHPALTETTFDAAGMLVSPGFINLHVHGGLGADTLDAAPDSLATIAHQLAMQGVTAFLPTAASSSPEKMIAVARAIHAYMAAPGQGAQVLGLHAEGPYLSPEKAGAQNPATFRDPDWEEFRAWRAASGNAVRLLALAPERDPQGTFTRKAAACGVVVAAAHTNASYQQAKAAIQAGLSHATHVFNAMSRFDYRAPGVLEALLEHEQVTLELIPDCTAFPHVHPAAIRLLKRIAGAERICTITDAVRAAGMPDGEYTLGGLPVKKAGDIVFLNQSGEAGRERRLAGSVLAMNQGVRNLIEQAGFSRAEALRTATANPARVLGLPERKGALEAGQRADVVVLQPESFEVAATFVAGKLVFQRAEGLKETGQAIDPP